MTANKTAAFLSKLHTFTNEPVEQHHITTQEKDTACAAHQEDDFQEELEYSPSSFQELNFND